MILSISEEQYIKIKKNLYSSNKIDFKIIKELITIRVGIVGNPNREIFEKINTKNDLILYKNSDYPISEFCSELIKGNVYLIIYKPIRYFLVIGIGPLIDFREVKPEILKLDVVF